MQHKEDRKGGRGEERIKPGSKSEEVMQLKALQSLHLAPQGLGLQDSVYTAILSSLYSSSLKPFMPSSPFFCKPHTPHPYSSGCRTEVCTEDVLETGASPALLPGPASPCRAAAPGSSPFPNLPLGLGMSCSTDSDGISHCYYVFLLVLKASCRQPLFWDPRTPHPQARRGPS